MKNKLNFSLKVTSLLFILIICMGIAFASDTNVMQADNEDLINANENICNINEVEADIIDENQLSAVEEEIIVEIPESSSDSLKDTKNVEVIHTGDDLSDIQTAINSASVGDTVLLGDYAYNIGDGQIDITKNITLKGNGESTYIHGTGGIKVGCIFEVLNVNGATIEGIIFNNTNADLSYTDQDTLYGWAIRLDNSNRNIITNCIFLNFNRGINIDASNGNTISGCYFTGATTRITNGAGKERGTRAISFSSNCKSNKIINNTFEGPMLDAINIDAATYTTIEGNYFINNAYSIYLDQSATANSTITNNTFINCGHFEAVFEGQEINFQNLPIICAVKSFDNLNITDNNFYVNENNLLIYCKVASDIGNVNIMYNNVIVNETANASTITFIKFPTEKDKLNLIGDIKIRNNHLPVHMVLEEYSNEKIYVENNSIIYVNHTGNDTKDLQTAIDYAFDGDTIELEDYNYTNIDTLKVNKNLRFTGEKASISLSSSTKSAFLIENDSIKFAISNIIFKISKNYETLVLNKVKDDISLIELSNIELTSNGNILNETISLVSIEANKNALSVENIKFKDNLLLNNMKTVTFLINKTPAKIICSNMVTKTVDVSSEGKIGKYLTITLKDSANKILAGKKIQIILNGNIYTKTTDKNGKVRLQINLKNAGTYKFAIVFLGDDQYSSIFKTGKITVKKQKPKLTVAKKTYKVSSKKKMLKATFKSANGKAIKGKKIIFKVNKKTYTAKTNKKGIATVKVKISKKGTYSFTAKFKADKTFYGVSKKGKLIIK